jgi:transketolase
MIAERDQQCVNTIRFLCVEMVQKADGGITVDDACMRAKALLAT